MAISAGLGNYIDEASFDHNINGVIDLNTFEQTMRFDDTINAASTIAQFQQIEQASPQAQCIAIICDNVRYYRSKAVNLYLKTPKIELVFLPAYAPNLNNRYYNTFDRFKRACKAFLDDASISCTGEYAFGREFPDCR